MSIGIYYISSSNADIERMNQMNREYVNRLQDLCGIDMQFCKADELDQYDLPMVFIGGGGTEGFFREVFDQLPKPVFLLTTGMNNSLAASMEILSYLSQHDTKGEILHGSDEYVASRIKALAKVFEVRKRLKTVRFGRIGQPSDWLISSDVDAEDSYQKNGIKIIDVTMEEFFDEIHKNEYEPNEYTELVRRLNSNEKDFEISCSIYGALKRLIKKYDLNGVTVRCFDLLGPIKGTGCMALAVLNAEGIYASCEGDTPALISMYILGELSGKPVFMANPSRILSETDEMIFAHCTLPLNMPYKIDIMTHYESGLGIAFRGKITEGDVTVFKTSGLLDRYFVSKAEISENLTETFLCRTQIKVRISKECIQYFLTDSIGNHHLFVNGDHEQLVREFYKWL